MEKEEIQTTMATLINDVRIIVERGLKKAYRECLILHRHTFAIYSP